MAEGLNIAADWGEFFVGEWVVQRMGGRGGLSRGCGRGPKNPKREHRMAEDDFGGLASVEPVFFQDNRRSVVHFREELLEGCGGGESVVGEGEEGVLVRQVGLR